MKSNSNNIPDINGLELLTCVMNGIYPPAPISETIPMNIVSVESGIVVFSARAGRQHLNPLGGVHGGFAATVLDSVTGCAVHTLLDAGVGYATIDLNIKMLKPVLQNTELTAIGQIISISSRLGVSEGTLKDIEGQIYAHATATCMIFR